MKHLNKKKLKFGVVGLGFGAVIHIPALLSRNDVELLGVCGKSEQKTKRIAIEYGVPNYYCNIEKMLEMNLDAVTLALPPKENEKILLQVLKKKIPVLIEKPLTNTLSVANSLVNNAENVITGMNFIFAELKTFKKLKDIIESKKLGNVISVNINWYTQSWAFKEKKWSWKTNYEENGGVISLFGSHLFYLLEWFFGDIKYIQAQVGQIRSESSRADNIPAEDLVNCFMKHENGMVSSANFGNNNPGISLHEWIVSFEEGYITLRNNTKDYMSGFKLTVFDKNDKKINYYKEKDSQIDGRLQPFNSLLDKFIKSIINNDNNVVPNIKHGRRVQFLDNCLRLSVEKEKKVSTSDYFT